ncbi:Fur family transcriptional regulator [Gulosibacter bifidus]|uniref:Fur family transcriptional regulator n=1 Tax=Gulosibacter bifidus TaxID=272239 RepID=A0ABW5RIX5_9MICO|nr:Fur family transcriptional regulator [Gulosibacter bifidus]
MINAAHAHSATVAGGAPAAAARASAAETIDVNWPDRIRAAGLRVTSGRLALLRALDAHPHATVEEVYELAVAEGHLTKQAVYVSLAEFTNRGLVRRIDPPGSAARYETRTDDNHHHLVCDECGCIVDVDCAIGAAPCLQPADDAGFTVRVAEVTYRGTCQDCQHAAA